MTDRARGYGGILIDIAHVVVAQFPRCRECGEPIVDACEAYGLRGLKCCARDGCSCNGRPDNEPALRPTADGLAVADAVRTLAAWLRGDMV